MVNAESGGLPKIVISREVTLQKRNERILKHHHGYKAK